MRRRYKREEKKETIPIHQCAGLRRRRHVHAPPVAVVSEVHAPPVFPQIPDGFPAVTVMFGGMYPVILELLRFCLVNFDFCSHC